MKILAYTLSPWEHAIVYYRLTSPCLHADMELLRGNLYDDVSYDLIDEADLIVIQRDFPRLLDPFCTIVDRARSLSKPVILDIDDNLFELPADHPDRLSHYYTEALYPILAASNCVDAITTSTKVLQEYFRRINASTYLLPNFLDGDIWRAQNVHPDTETDQIIIGYVGGDSHIPDLEMVQEVFKNLLGKYGNRIHLHFVGAKPPIDQEAWENVTWTQLQIPDYKEYTNQFTAQIFDILIAPLKNNPFNHSKSTVKYFEYIIMGIPGVYSRITPYDNVIDHGRNGFLASSDSEWELSLSSLIDDYPLRVEIGQAAKRNVCDNWLIADHAHWWRSTYSHLISFVQERKSTRLYPTEVLRNIGKQYSEWKSDLEKS